MNEKYIKLKLKEENHKVIMANYEQPYKKETSSFGAWRGEMPSPMVYYNPTPINKVEIAKLFMEISQEILKQRDIEWLEIKSDLRPSPNGADTRLQIRVDLWTDDNE